MEQVSEVPQYKTGFELLKMIKEAEPYLASQIFENIKEQKNSDLLIHRYGNAQAMVRQTFVWGETKQGHEYWNELSHTLRFIK